MKKILMTLAAVAVAATMNAQLYVGGSFTLQGGKNTSESMVNVNGVNITTTDDVNTFAFGLLPEIGYKFGDNMAVGAQIGFEFNKSTQPTTNGTLSADITSKGFKFKFAPYFRYYFAQWEKVGLFFDAQFGLGLGKDTQETPVWITDTNGNIIGVGSTDYDVKKTEVSFAIIPGVSYQASDKVSIVAKLGDGVGYWFKKTTTPHTYGGYTYDAVDKSNTYGLNLKTIGLNVSVYYNF
jgi:hypothetical protein